jgi:predicted membrane metal-binding protein
MSKALKMPTDRSFGLTFAGVFAVVGAWLTWRAHRLGVPALGLAVLFALVALTVPRILHPLNVVWAYFGLLLNKIVSPIVLGAIFFVLFTPVSLLFRLIGRDILRRSYERDLRSYWIDRTPPGPDGKTSFPRQF